MKRLLSKIRLLLFYRLQQEDGLCSFVLYTILRNYARLHIHRCKMLPSVSFAQI